MARVVTKPKGPPYLLIVFIFLFLIAATLMVLTFNQKQEVEKQLQEVRAVKDKLASARNLLESDIASWLKSPDQMTVVERLVEEKKALINHIVGSAATTVEDVGERVKATRAQVGGTGQPLLEEMRNLKALHDTKEEQLQAVTKERDEANQKFRDQEQVAINLAKKVEEMGAAFAKEKEQLSTQISKYQTEHEAKVEDIKKSWDSARDELNKTIASLTEKSTKMDSTNKQLNNKIRELEQEVKRLQPVTQKNIELMPQADGKVVKVLEGQNLCYISLGSMDRVIPGLTFSVYSSSGIPETGEGKAKVTVTEVSETISLCRIDNQSPTNPVIATDIVANVVYDPNRTYAFVVEGQFDLFGTGQPSAAGADEIKALVRKYRGTIADAVTPQTDFVVMGEEPPRPPKPTEAASEQAKKVYDDQLKEWKHYQDVREQAAKMQIPILNTNRFLALVGYTATKK
ncbi:MAG: hypothetical protein BWX88_04735 [Planctomycetes bacterium ADurb.Bin126]|nr:MAG: hypothetical protein BWX88_04735 [Planctomycetes bacterium ADurb.Bin126]HOD79865.1 hypothetical protein [Phycisphaerae bacterium]HQL72874.1 hypothetical protein [Phycisphaerae bacterium]